MDVNVTDRDWSAHRCSGDPERALFRKGGDVGSGLATPSFWWMKATSVASNTSLQSCRKMRPCLLGRNELEIRPVCGCEA